ncbi:MULTISPECIES: long-chain fatty acid--CoA ligase [unclassified Paenibacillus]|uniref:long-chain-fatty-acid--CoA ligase n=1 Tax=unclassified Paenibacillus TaxID=185978 RepID=UPI002784D156|nr:MULTISPECIES: long-chain fatty acid--CoA ligase [unclassified Paenibacillus]MDQ0898659.1 long-chain acyl-CoA synthetase [Paenibacillus sp. V4I7]MDQ0915349.1 long-chain acyl-CoA synthetase [Paenibacillus sp. V4I5]
MNEAKPWLRHYPSEVAPTYEYPKHNLARLLVDSAHKFPDRPALYFLGKTLRYREVLEASYRFANALKELGVSPGDRVSIMLPNCPSAIIAYFGTLMMGGIVVMTNPLYVERELVHQLSDSGATVIVTLDLLFDRVQKAKGKTPIRHVIVTSIKDYLPFPKNVLYPIKMKKDGANLAVTYGDGVYSYKKMLREASRAPICVDVKADEDIALLQYTGGTTGISKGVMLTHTNLIANTYQTSHWCYRIRLGEERFLGAIPCFHVFGLTVLLNQSMYRAGMLILIPKFDINMILDTIHTLKPTIFPGAPTMYIALINHKRVKEVDISSINVCVSGSAPLPLEVQERFEALTGGRLIEGYGLTEASPVTHANPIWGFRKIGSIGIPFPDTDTKVIDSDSGQELPIGEIGEIIIKGPQVMKGYWQREHETAMTIRDGWLYTGDMGRIDEDGFFSIVDRKKDLIIAGGYNIYPRDIEEVLFEHPAIMEAAVAGVPDEYRGETVKAFVVLRPGMTLTEKELELWCRERLAAYKVPRKVEFRQSLPKTMIGKVLRRQLLEEEKKA